MMSEKQIFLLIAIIGLVIFFLLKLIYIEGFTDPNPTTETTPTSGAITEQTCQPVISNRDWWLNESPKQIVSYISGVRFPVIAIQPTKGLNSSFQIPYIKAGESESSGCIVVLNDGTYTTRMCNADSSEQRWRIVQINNSETFSLLLKKGAEYYSGSHTNTILPQGIDYGFFMVVSEKDPSMVLASNGGNITVQRIGNFTAQFWDITKDVGTASIAIYSTVENTGLAPNYSSSSSPGVGVIYQVPGVSGPTVTSAPGSIPSSAPGSSPGLITSSGGQPFNINLNLDKQSLISMFGSLDTLGPGFTVPTSSGNVDKFANVDGSVSLGNNKSKCKPCPSILTDYIAQNEIPCLGCKL